MERMKNLNKSQRLTAGIIVLLLATAAIAYAVSLTIHMTAPAAAGQGSFYMDAAATQQITDPWDWALHGVSGLHNLDTISVYFKNSGSTALTVTISILNPSCYITTDPDNFVLAAGDTEQIILTFDGIVSGSPVTWDLIADY